MNQPEDPRLIGRLSAFAETAILLVAGSLAARAIAGVFDLGDRAGVEASLYQGAGPDWLGAALAESQWLGLRFGLTLFAAFMICRWIGGPSRRLAGLSRGNHSLSELAGFGVVMGIILAAPPFALRTLSEFYGLGENTPFWDLMARSEWTPFFWLYMAASSFILVPIAEELFFRSYMLGRFRMHFSAGGAVLLSAAVFWVSHGQYLKLDPVLAATSALVFASAAILAWSVIHTGSVLPALIAHAIFNIPMSAPFRIAAVVLALALAVMLHKRIGEVLTGFFQALAATKEWAFLAAIAVVLTVAAYAVRTYESAQLPLIGVFVILLVAGLIRRAPWTRRNQP